MAPRASERTFPGVMGAIAVGFTALFFLFFAGVSTIPFLGSLARSLFPWAFAPCFLTGLMVPRNARLIPCLPIVIVMTLLTAPAFGYAAMLALGFLPFVFGLIAFVGVVIGQVTDAARYGTRALAILVALWLTVALHLWFREGVGMVMLETTAAERRTGISAGSLPMLAGPDDRVEALLIIALRRAREGRISAAKEIFERVRSTAELCGPNFRYRLGELASAQVKAGLGSDAEATMAIADPNDPTHSWFFAYEYLRAHDFVAANKYVERIEDPNRRFVVLAAIAEEQAATGADAEARATIERLWTIPAGDDVQTLRIRDIAFAQARCGFIDEAIETAKKSGDRSERALQTIQEIIDEKKHATP